MVAMQMADDDHVEIIGGPAQALEGGQDGRPAIQQEGGFAGLDQIAARQPAAAAERIAAAQNCQSHASLIRALFDQIRRPPRKGHGIITPRMAPWRRPFPRGGRRLTAGSPISARRDVPHITFLAKVLNAPSAYRSFFVPPLITAQQKSRLR
jgi:hypothetical protein